MKGSAGRRILMLLENNPYPQDTRVRREATSLVRAGWQVTVVAPRAWQQHGRERVQGVRVYRYPAGPSGGGMLGYLAEYSWALFWATFLSFRVLRREGFDILHVHNPPEIYFALGAFYRLLGKRFVFDHHDLSPEMYEARFPGRSSGLVKRALLLCERLTFRVAHLVIATNESYRAIATGRGRVPPERVTVVRNGPDTELFSPGPPDPDLRSRAGVLFGYVGQMGNQDGIDYLLRSLAELRNRWKYDDFHCWLVGEGEARPSLMELCRSLRLDDRVTFTGYVSRSELLRHLRSVHVGVVPDPRNEFTDRSTMIKVGEYMALGKPVVAFDLTEHRQTAKDAALYAPANDEAQFAACLLRLAQDPGLRERMGSIARERALAHLDWRVSEGPLIAAYEQLSARREKRRAPAWP